MMEHAADGRPLGAGTGLNFPYYRAGAEVAAVEPDPGMRGRAAKRAGNRNLDRRTVEALRAMFNDN